MYALLPWDGTTFISPTLRGGNGEPDAKITFPFVQANASSAVHSALCVGFDIGIITGRSQFDAIASQTSFVKTPPCPLTPINTVAFTF